MAHSSSNIGKHSRRRFLQQTATTGSAVAVGYWTSSAVAESRLANDKLNIGCIGVGGKGEVDAAGVANENIVAICDVDENMLGKSATRYTKATRFVDFRRLLEQKDIDAVTVSTPDHTHAVASVMAMRLGKHVYCQKPLAHSIHEVRVMHQVARASKVATQMGNQGHSVDGSRQMVELIKAGVLGQVSEVHIWTDRPIWPQGISRPAGTPPVPSHLHWDLWLGPAKERPYHRAYHPFKWRGFWDFGTGALGDMGCHNMDIAFWALDLDYPTSIEAESTGVTTESAPSSSIVRYQFPAKGKRPPVKFTWYDGKNRPPAALVPGQKYGTNGSIIVGSEATLYVPHYWGVGKIVPENRLVDFRAPRRSIPVSPGHYQEWITACKGGPAALSNFDYACQLSETVLLGNLALRTGKKIDWDRDNMRAKGVPEADQFIRPAYRSGWTL